MEYARGNVLEQYENLTSGIKAHLVINDSLKGSDPLGITIQLSGNMTPRLEPGDSEIEFLQNNKALVSFQDIQAGDAKGKNLPLKTSLKDNEFHIQVEEQGAAYPIHVDFLLSSLPPWSAESDHENALFGTSVCTAGDVNADGYSDLIIGAPNFDNGQDKEGKAFVYYGSPSGPSLTSDWGAESDHVYAYLGCSVSTAGDINGDGYSDVIIGAKYYTNDKNDQGAVYIFYGSASGLGNVSIREGSTADTHFGNSVCTTGDVNGDGYGDVIVGGESYNNYQGRVGVYFGSDTGLSTSSWGYYGYEGAHSGHSVATAGDVDRDGYADFIIGANTYSNEQTDEGRAIVYHGSADGVYGSAIWNYEPNQASCNFGESVCTAGDVNGDGYSDVIVGAPNYSNGQNNEGVVMIFYGSASGPSDTPNMTIESNRQYTLFGASVSLAGDWNGDGYADVIVGAPGYESDIDHTNEGAAYIYCGSSSGLKESSEWFQRSDQKNAKYGASVSIAGDVNGDGYSDVIVGAPNYDSGQTDEGKCFLYYGKPKPPTNTPDWYTNNTVAACEFAMSVAGAGDVNGDGYSDIMVGAYLFDNGQENEGRVFIYHGRAHNVPSTTANRILESNLENAYFGDALASAGDINADGYDDIVIGAVRYSNFEGRVYAYYGSSTGIGTSANWVKEPNLAGGHFGGSVAGAGDVNGDGYSDIIIGMPYYPNGTANGRAYVYHGTPTGLTSTNRWNYTCDQEGAFFGTSVASAGDVNRDGYADVIIGATGYTNGQADEGRAYVFYGSYYGVNSNSPWTIESNQANSVFGQSVSTAGDVNGDGFSDVIIGAPYYNSETNNEGAAFIYSGGEAGLSQTPIASLDDANQENARFGYSVAGLGDVNGDGFADVIVGAYLRDNMVIFTPTSPSAAITRVDAGSAYIYLGSPTGPSNTSDWSEHYLGESGYFGRCVAGAGDVNGDGFADVIIGAPGYSVSDIKYGRAYLYLGGGGNGRLIHPRQMVPNQSRSISKMGRSENAGWNMGIMEYSPFGRGKVKTQFDINILQFLLDGTYTFIPDTWDDLTNNTIAHDISVYSYENTIWHWRARVLYNSATCPYQIHGPWITIPWNGWQEGDVRLGPSSYVILRDIVNYLLGKSHFPHDTNSDGKSDAADVVKFLLTP